ncbi:uncharacterized protein SOCG_01115 [Schizosaccharomyces octosporus yFS286]|uniref:Uncharacterized protein n=1 Tax=Schizosaccharomyces octosporus (strain yFS286) TaxID=483514 RepID=S9R4T5_SCHOY|nr:uncharacterized protein SOCG_01115 [Schizosaccharomyces octosporus yFS286]EPX73365.1 hypothetical protein SOCG_01115 [Schizosaccharomyces octosporus yFS286]
MSSNSHYSSPAPSEQTRLLDNPDENSDQNDTKFTHFFVTIAVGYVYAIINLLSFYYSDRGPFFVSNESQIAFWGIYSIALISSTALRIRQTRDAIVFAKHWVLGCFMTVLYFLIFVSYLQDYMHHLNPVKRPVDLPRWIWIMIGLVLCGSIESHAYCIKNSNDILVAVLMTITYVVLLCPIPLFFSYMGLLFPLKWLISSPNFFVLSLMSFSAVTLYQTSSFEMALYWKKKFIVACLKSFCFTSCIGAPAFISAFTKHVKGSDNLPKGFWYAMAAIADVLAILETMYPGALYRIYRGIKDPLWNSKPINEDPTEEV